MTETTPRIYVACLASYNAGTLHGAWIDLDGKDAEDVRGEIAAMLARSPVPGAEEFAIHDFDGLPRIDEWESIEDVCKLADAIDQLGAEIVIAACECFGTDYVIAESDPHDFIASHYAGSADTVAEWAQDYADDSGNAPTGEFAPYVDWNRWARDQPIMTARVDGTLIVFWNQ